MPPGEAERPACKCPSCVVCGLWSAHATIGYDIHLPVWVSCKAKECTRLHRTPFCPALRPVDFSKAIVVEKSSDWCGMIRSKGGCIRP